MPTIAPIRDAAHFSAVCPTCGRRFLSHTLGKRGKPREYCTDECSKVARTWSAFESAFLAVLPRLTISQVFQWRGALLGLASGRAWNVGVPAKMTRQEAVAREVAAERARQAQDIERANAAAVKKNPRRRWLRG
jgi:hypothetical protein